MTDAERIAEIEARLAKATPSTVLFSPWGESDAYRDTVHFFSRSDTDIRDLLAEVRRQKERIEKLEGALEFYRLSRQGLVSSGVLYRLSNTEAERDAALEQVRDYQVCHEDHKRLVREIDVIMHGEDGAAKQASLCDLVNPIKIITEQVRNLTARIDALEEDGYLKNEKIDKLTTVADAVKIYLDADGSIAAIEMMSALREAGYEV